LWAEHGYAKSNAMPTDELAPRTGTNDPKNDVSADKRRLTPAAERALAEAAARRAASDRREPIEAKEVDGRKGPEPTRYGDWEVNGLASDF
jgi:hypothetical protein